MSNKISPKEEKKKGHEDWPVLIYDSFVRKSAQDILYQVR